MVKAKKEQSTVKIPFCGNIRKTNTAVPNPHLNKAGITLVALVITIIIMLILAGVAMSLIIRENGLFDIAKYAAQKNSEEVAREKLELALSELWINKVGEAHLIDINEFDQESSENFQQGITVNNKVTSEDTQATVSVNGYTFIIDENLKIISISKSDLGINLQVWQEEGTIKIKVIGTEQISKIIITRPDQVTYIKEYENEQNIQVEYSAVIGGTYQIKVEGNTQTTEKSITLQETQIIEGETYYLIYGVEDLKNFMTKVSNGKTNINAKLMNDVNENLYNSRNLVYDNLKMDGDTIISTTDDPFIYLKDKVCFQNISAAYIEFEEEITQDISTEIYYSKNADYNESSVVRQTIPKGTKQTVINLPDGDYCIRFDIGKKPNISYKIKILGYIPKQLEENNWNAFIQSFEGKMLGNGHRIVILKNNLEYDYENLYMSREKERSNSLSFNDNTATITGDDPYIRYNANFKNVCGLKVELSPNTIVQYFWAINGNWETEATSKITTEKEISITKMDYTTLRYDFKTNGGTFTITGLYCKYCIDKKKLLYENEGQIMEEYYAKDIKVKEESKKSDPQITNLVVEMIAPNI